LSLIIKVDHEAYRPKIHKWIDNHSDNIETIPESSIFKVDHEAYTKENYTKNNSTIS